MKIEIRNGGEIHISGYVNAVERKRDAAAKIENDQKLAVLKLKAS